MLSSNLQPEIYKFQNQLKFYKFSKYMIVFVKISYPVFRIIWFSCLEIISYSAALISKPLVTWSEGVMGYSPLKHASQYCGCS